MSVNASVTGRRLCVAAGAVCILLASAVPVGAQPMDRFVRAVGSFAAAMDGVHGDEGPALAAAVEELAAGLAEWDRVIERMEAGLAADIRTAPPQTAARMRGTLGAAYLERGRREEGLRELDLALTLDPRLAAAHMLRGVVFEAEGRPREAAAAYRLAWQHAPDAASGYHLLRFVRLREPLGPADEARAFSVLASAAEQATAPSSPLLSLSLLDDTSAADPVFVPAAYAAAAMRLKRGDYSGAAAGIRMAMAADPLVTDAALRSREVLSALSAARGGNQAGAAAGLAAAAERWPQSSELRRLLGQMYRALGRHDDSLAAFRSAIGLDGRNERARLALADALATAGTLGAAREALIETIGALPDSGRAYWHLGRIYQALGDEGSALGAFERAAAIGPLLGEGRVHAALGRLYHNSFDLEAAAESYRRRISLAPNDAEAHADLGELYRSQGQPGQARPELLMAVILDPGRARAVAALGQAEADEGRDEQAVRWLRRALALDAGHLEARYALSRALLRLGRTDEAGRELTRFQERQAQAMAEERRRFQENLEKIERTLEAVRPEEPAR